MDFSNNFKNCIKSFESIELLNNDFNSALKLALNCLKKNNKILFCGNGGSASDSQHIAAELVGKFLIKKRKAFNAISLTSNSSIITAIANDFSFNLIFSRQIEAIGRKDDILFAISTSGKSKNIQNAIKSAFKKKMKVILLTSVQCNLKSNNNILVIKVRSKRTDRIQEQHIAFSHLLCENLEKYLN